MAATGTWAMALGGGELCIQRLTGEQSGSGWGDPLPFTQPGWDNILDCTKKKLWGLPLQPGTEQKPTGSPPGSSLPKSSRPKNSQENLLLLKRQLSTCTIDLFWDYWPFLTWIPFHSLMPFNSNFVHFSWCFQLVAVFIMLTVILVLALPVLYHAHIR